MFFGGRTLRPPCDREVPTVANGHETQSKAKERAEDCCGGRGDVQQVADHHHGCAGQCGDGMS
jgi:hypothetical protein